MIAKLLRHPLEAALHAAAIAFAVVALARPFFAARYPPLTDLPFHAAQTSILRHYFDPSFHFREQFSLHPIAVPYLSSYVLGAIAMLVFSAETATKIAAFVMLALLPAGLAVLASGMKKSPLLGLLGLGLAFGNLTHWGFLNFLGAIGLFAMCVGLALHLVRAPSRAKSVALGAALVVLFFTHIFRFPFAICGVVGGAIVMFPATRRLRVVVAPMLPSLALFAAWLVVRPKSLEGSAFPIALHTERLGELRGYLFGSFTDPGEARAVASMQGVLELVVITSIVFLAIERPWSRWNRRAWLDWLGARVAVLACALVFLGLYLVLPMQMGIWWYVYPREATAFVLVLFALAPDLPKSLAARAALSIAIAWGVSQDTSVVVANWAKFDTATADFAEIEREIPKAPKLMYLVFDHSGSTRTNTPFIHLPAYVQADEGGWLSFHFAVFNASPIAYRSPSEPGAVVPPPIPAERWEWRPQLFDVTRHGPFFDWFLVRSVTAPDRWFSRDPTIEKVDRKGTWWLYRRKP